MENTRCISLVQHKKVEKHLKRPSPSSKNKNSRGGGAPKGRGSSQRNPEPRDRGHYSQDRHYEYNQDQEYYEEYEEPRHFENYGFPRQIGVGRSAGPASHPGRDSVYRPGYNSDPRRDPSRERRNDRRHREEGYGTDRSSSMDRRRGSGAQRAHKHGYGKKYS